MQTNINSGSRRMNAPQKSLKIGILLRNRHDGPGGLEKVLDIVAREMRHKSVELSFYGLYELKYDVFTKNFKSVTYLELPKLLQWLKKILSPKIFRVINKNYIKFNTHKLLDQMIDDNLDILIAMDLSKQFLVNYQLLKEYKKRSNALLLSWVHGSLLESNDHVYTEVKDKINIFDGHLAVSSGIQQQLIEDYNAKNVSLVYNPVDSAKILPQDKYKLIYIGRIDENKRVIELLTQLSLLKGQWRLDIYGSTGNHKKDIAFLDKISALGLLKRVYFHGWKDDPWKEIDKAGILLLNSKEEAFGLVIIEAMQRGIPVLAAASQGPRELVLQGENGWLYPVGKESAGVELLDHILAGKIQLPESKKVQESVRKYATSNYIDGFIATLRTYLN